MEQKIIKLLRDAGIEATEEYFLDGEVSPPYAVVLVPQAETDGDDMGEYILIRQVYRIELFTLSKSAPARDVFKRVIFSNFGYCGGFSIEEESYAAGRLYLTAIEFTDTQRYELYE